MKEDAPFTVCKRFQGFDESGYLQWPKEIPEQTEAENQMADWIAHVLFRCSPGSSREKWTAERKQAYHKLILKTYYVTTSGSTFLLPIQISPPDSESKMWIQNQVVKQWMVKLF